MYCKECGNQIAEDSKFCANCGKPQNEEVVPSSVNFGVSSLQLKGKITNEENTSNFTDVESEKKEALPLLIKYLSITAIIFFAINVILVSIVKLPQTNPLKKLFQENQIIQNNSKQFKIARIKYEITGTTPSASVTLTNSSGGTEQYNIKLPGAYEFSVPIKRGSFNYYHAYISAQNNNSRGSITVTIYVNGKKIKTATSEGAYVIASTDAAIEYKHIE